MFQIEVTIRLTVTLLETSTGRATSVLLGITTSGIRDEKRAVVLHQSVTDLVLAALINVFSVVGDNTLRNCGTDGVDLSGHTSSLYADSDIEVGELILTE